jgi:uncharacterized membrane protein
MTYEADAKAPLTQAEINEQEWTNAENWKLGMFYYSQRDSRVWVPKRTLFGRQQRLGGTPNFAKPAARLYVLVVTSMLFGMILVLMVLRRLEVLR